MCGSDPRHSSKESLCAKQGWTGCSTCLVGLDNFATPERVCVSSLVSHFHRWDKGPEKSNIKDGNLTLANGSRSSVWLAPLLLGL